MRTLSCGVDLDGVVYDFVAALRSWLNLSTGRDLATMPDAAVWAFFSEQWGMTTSEFLEAMSSGVAAGHIFVEGAPYPGATEALASILDAGHQVHLVTDRALPGLEEVCAAATAAWVARWGIPHTSLTISADKTVLRTDVFVDDRVENYDALEAAGMNPWLFSRPWNAAHPTTRRVADLAGFAAVVHRLSATPAPRAA